MSVSIIICCANDQSAAWCKLQINKAQTFTKKITLGKAKLNSSSNEKRNKRNTKQNKKIVLTKKTAP